MKNKAFTLVELISVLVLLAILAIIIIPTVSYYTKGTKKETYLSHEKTMLRAAESYTIEVLNGNINLTLPSDGNSINVYLIDLENNEFIKELNDPDGGTCDNELSYVKISNNSGNYNYSACLHCGKYVTDSNDCQ